MVQVNKYMAWSVVALLVIANSLLFIFPLLLDASSVWLSGICFSLQAHAALLLAAWLPGLLMARLLTQPVSRLDKAQQILYGIGIGYGFLVFPTLILSYMPGGIARWQTALLYNALDIILLALLLRKSSTNGEFTGNIAENGTEPQRHAEKRRWISQHPWLLVGLLLWGATAGFFRFAGLHYAEFQGDEATVVVRAAHMLQGDEDALLGHMKGPVEILLPAVIYALTGHLTEATARLPFALANLAGLGALFVLGYRMFGPLAGWSAAMLLALDGYFIAFGRIVQYQSVVFFLVVLVVLVLYTLLEEFTPRPSRSLSGRKTEDADLQDRRGVKNENPRSSAFIRVPLFNGLLLASFFLSTSLLAHYEAALVVPPALYLLCATVGRGLSWSLLLRTLLLPVLLGSVLVMSFYLPFVLHPAFRITYAYITDNRIGDGFIYNNLADVFQRTTLYSSSYFLALMIGLAVGALAALYGRTLTRRGRWLGSVLLLVGVIAALIAPNGLTFGAVDYTGLLIALPVMLGWFLPKVTVSERMIWLWFGVPMILALFFIATPNTHVYGFFMGWALLGGMSVQRVWGRLTASSGSSWRLRWGAVCLAIGLLGLFARYEYALFVRNDVEVLRTWPEQRPAGYWVPYTTPIDRSIFGFPLRNGWKAVATLYTDGVLHGAFDTNAKAPIAEWYTRGGRQCVRDSRYFILTDTVEPTDDVDLARLRTQVEAEHTLLATVLVHDEPRLRIYQRGAANGAPQRLAIDPLAMRFDEELSYLNLVADGVAGNPTPANPLNFQFGEGIRLLGYEVDSVTVAPGAEVTLTLYWQTTQPLRDDYSVFNQVINMETLHKAGQRDGEPGCDQLPTSRWQPGRIITDRYRISIFADAPPGSYTLLMGMYHTESGDRLPILDAEGQNVGDSLRLLEITVS